MNESKRIPSFKRRWLTLGEAAAALETDEEGLLQAFEIDAARELPVYVHSDRANFSGQCAPLEFAFQLADNDELRESVGDQFGRIANDTRRERAKEWERWFQLIGTFRIFPSMLRRIARERALFVCRVAPGSWWSDNSPIPKNASGDPKVRFEVKAYDGINGERPISFDRIRFKADDIQGYVASVRTAAVEASISDPPSGEKWPWGTHETEALRHLEAAAKQFWVNYDPDDPTTAVTNETVVKWLMARRGMTRRMASSIASLLRADGLPSGRRK